MTAIFLYGTLCHAPLLRIVAGEDLATTPAVLPGLRAVPAPGRSWPMLERVAEGTEGAAGGALIAPGPEALVRLDFYEACFGYVRRPVRVRAGGAEMAAEAWFPETDPATASGTASGTAPAAGAPASGMAGPDPSPGDRSLGDRSPGDWSLEDWAQDWGALTCLAAGEAMRAAGREDPRAVGRRMGILRARADASLRAGAWRRPGLVGHGFARADAICHEVRHIHDGFLALEEVRASHARFDGGREGPALRSVVRVADAVTVLPYDPLRDRILLIEQFRFGPYAHGDAAPWLLEPVAGLIDAGETIEETARREAREEARLELGALHFIARYYPTPGGVAQVLFSFLGIADLPDAAAGLAGHPEEGEDILSHVVPYALALRMLAEGDMANAPLVMSMQYLMLHRERLRAAALAGRPPSG